MTDRFDRHTQRLVALVKGLGLAIFLLDSCYASNEFGVVSTDGKSACIATTKKIESFPLQVRVVVPEAPQRLITGVITAPLKKPCEALAKSDLGGLFYSLRITKEMNPWELGVTEFGDHASAQVRACTSSEGVHLTAWVGKPLSGKRLWHEYVYLGYDVESTCSEQDFDE